MKWCNLYLHEMLYEVYMSFHVMFFVQLMGDKTHWLTCMINASVLFCTKTVHCQLLVLFGVFFCATVKVIVGDIYLGCIGLKSELHLLHGACGYLFIITYDRGQWVEYLLILCPYLVYFSGRIHITVKNQHLYMAVCFGNWWPVIKKWASIWKENLAMGLNNNSNLMLFILLKPHHVQWKNFATSFTVTVRFDQNTIKNL